MMMQPPEAGATSVGDASRRADGLEVLELLLVLVAAIAYIYVMGFVWGRTEQELALLSAVEFGHGRGCSCRSSSGAVKESGRDRLGGRLPAPQG